MVDSCGVMHLLVSLCSAACLFLGTASEIAVEFAGYQNDQPEAVHVGRVGMPSAGLMRFERPTARNGGQHPVSASATLNATALKGTASLIAKGEALTVQQSKAKGMDGSSDRHAPWIPPEDPAEHAAAEMKSLREDAASAHRVSEWKRSMPQEASQSYEAQKLIQAEDTASNKLTEERPVKDAIIAVHDPAAQWPRREHPRIAEGPAGHDTDPPAPRSSYIIPTTHDAEPPAPRSSDITPIDAHPQAARSVPVPPSAQPARKVSLTAPDVDAETTDMGDLSLQRPDTASSTDLELWFEYLDERPYFSGFVIVFVFAALILMLVLCSRPQKQLQVQSSKRPPKSRSPVMGQQHQPVARPKQRPDRPFAMPPPTVGEDGHLVGASGQALHSKQAVKASGSSAGSTDLTLSAPAGGKGSSGISSTFSRIQASFGAFQDPADKAPPVAGISRRTLRQQQKIIFTCDVLEGHLGGILPDLGRLEPGCDPYVECRIIRGDPSMRPRGDVDRLPNFTAQTEVKRNDLNPRWNQTLAIPGAVYSEDSFMQLVLWDYDAQLERSYALGHFAMRLSEALAGSVDEGHEESHSKMRKEVFLFPVHQGEILALEAQLTVSFGFWEAHRYRLHVLSGSALPRVKSPGKISGYVEARIVRGDPFKKFRARPGGECVWSARTAEITDNSEPEWDQEFSFALACGGDPSLSLQLILWDSNLLSSKSPDMPVGHAVIKLEQITSGDPGSEPREHKLKLARLPAQRAVADISDTELLVNTSFHLEFAG